MKTFSSTLLLLTLSASLACGQELSATEINNLLAGIRARRTADPGMQADFHERKQIQLMTKPIETSGKVWFEAPNKFRREVKGNAPSLTVSNGTHLWIYYPNFKSAEQYKLGKHSPVDAAVAAINAALNVDDVEHNFRMTGSKTDKGYALTLIPRSPSTKRMFEKFDLLLNSDLLAERVEMFQPNGDRVVTNYTNQSRGQIPNSIFEFRPPQGTAVTTPLSR